jgi:hypothetical protein
MYPFLTAAVRQRAPKKTQGAGASGFISQNEENVRDPMRRVSALLQQLTRRR